MCKVISRSGLLNFNFKVKFGKIIFNTSIDYDKSTKCHVNGVLWSERHSC